MCARAACLAVSAAVAAATFAAAPAPARADEALAAAEAALAARNGEKGAEPPSGAEAQRLLDEAIAKAKAATESDPSSERAWILLARARYLRAELVPPDDEDEVEELYEEGFEAAVAALRLDEKVREESDDDDIDDALSLIEKDQAEALQWCLSNYARVVERVNVFSQAFAVGRLRRMAYRLAELDDTVYHGGPVRFLGAFCAEAPSMFGGDLEKSRKFFERAVEIAPDFIENRYLRAKTYAYRKGDRELFRKELQRGIDTPADAHPDAAFEQAYFRAKCRDLLAQESELFD